MLTPILCVIAGLAIGFLIAFWISRESEKKSQTQLFELDKERSVIETKLSQRTEECNKTNQALQLERETNLTQSTHIATLETEKKNLQEKLQTQKTEIEELQKRLTSEFENIANKILKERAIEFSSVNRKSIDEILSPLKEKISSFEKKVEETYDKELRDKLSLREEVKNLATLNARISEDANNLTKALKGDSKKQGNWGEVVLERVLERSGLSSGREYKREVVIECESGVSQRPDVIIYLPDNKHIIIDSKVSLVAYEQFMNAETEEERERHIKNHITSIKTHVKELSDKKYHHSFDVNAPDFVLLFLPIEASFSAALQHETDLFSFAWERKIVIVSPTTLLATLRTVSSIWKQENQTKNVTEIAKYGGILYDKLVDSISHLEKIKEHINKAANSYDEALKLITSGNNNIFRTADKIKKLGAKTSKSLPKSYIEEETEMPELPEG